MGIAVVNLTMCFGEDCGSTWTLSCKTVEHIKQCAILWELQDNTKIRAGNRGLPCEVADGTLRVFKHSGQKAFQYFELRSCGSGQLEMMCQLWLIRDQFLKGKPLLYWDIKDWSVRPEKLWMIKKRPVSLRWNYSKSICSSWAHGSCDQSVMAVSHADSWTWHYLREG